MTPPPTTPDAPTLAEKMPQLSDAERQIARTVWKAHAPHFTVHSSPEVATQMRIAIQAVFAAGQQEARREVPRGEVVVTKNERGEIVLVSRQDEEGRILSVIAEPDDHQSAATSPLACTGPSEEGAGGSAAESNNGAWIPVNNPASHGFAVLTLSKDGEQRVGYYWPYSGEWRMYGPTKRSLLPNVTHWMPLPSPPAAQGDSP